MNNTGRLTLAELKSKAENTNKTVVLEGVKGGSLSDCHGFWGRVGKMVERAASMGPMFPG